MGTSSVNVEYDPVQLSEALVTEFHASCYEISKELEKVGIKTDKSVAWLLSFSFAFSTRDQAIRKVFESLKFAPEVAERFSLGGSGLQIKKEEKINNEAGGKEDSDFARQGHAALAVLDQMPGLATSAKALSKLGICVLSLELAKFMLSKGEYAHFVVLLMVARETLVAWRLAGIGMAEKTLAAKANALKRHQETYQLRDEVINYYKANISPTFSNEKAANLLLSRFPLSHRKLKQYVAQAKRKDTSC